MTHDRSVEHEQQLEARLRAHVLATGWLCDALEALRDVALPDAWIAAGAVRNMVWDRLHDRQPEPPVDVDVAFFDPQELTPERDADATTALRSRLALPWEATNQAAVHRWYARVYGRDVSPLGSAAAGIASWPETATAVGVRLEGDTLVVCAPLGLSDLLAPCWRFNANGYASREQFDERTRAKRIAERWPSVRVLNARQRA